MLIETVAAQLLLHGNAYVQVLRDADGGAAEPGDDVVIAMRMSDQSLSIGIDGVAMSGTVDLEDRVGAAGGTLRVHDRHLRAVLPCG